MFDLINFRKTRKKREKGVNCCINPDAYVVCFIIRRGNSINGFMLRRSAQEVEVAMQEVPDSGISQFLLVNRMLNFEIGQKRQKVLCLNNRKFDIPNHV